MLLTISVPPLTDERQWSANDFWSCILDNRKAMERGYPILDSSATVMVKIGAYDIESTSDNSVPTECQQFLLGLSKVLSNQLNCIVT